MAFVSRKEGPCAPLFFSVATALLLTDVALPQSVDLSRLEECANLDTAELKLACFEAIIAENSSPIAETPGETPPIMVATEPSAEPEIKEPPPQAQTVASVAEPITGAETMAAAEAVTIVQPKSGAPGIEPAPEGSERQISIEEQPSVPAESEQVTEEFGAEQLPDPNRDRDQTITATVVDVRQGYNRTLSFHMANGQVWRQIEPRRLQYPKNEEFDVIISQGMLGEYRLRIGENGRLVKIRRVK